MKLLALETAMGACSAALWADGDVVAAHFEERSRGHAEILLPIVEDLMVKAGWAFADLDRVAATRGPGTFTGLRVGLSAIRGFALAQSIPALGIDTLEALAAGAGAETGVVHALIDARRSEAYWQSFTAQEGRLTPLSSAALLPVAEIAPQIEAQPGTLVGTGAALFGAETEALFPHAADVAWLAAARDPATAPPEPLYIRPPDAKLPGGREVPA